MAAFIVSFLTKIVKVLYPELHNTKFLVSNYKIIAQEFNDNSNETLFRISRRGKKDYMLLTARNCAANRVLLNQLSQEDAYLVGFCLASEIEHQGKNFYR